MGTLSGGGKEVITIGRRCLLGANSGLGIPLGDDCTLESGLYLTAGTKVRLRDMQANKTFEYHIVGSAEANPSENKLSNESPVGKAIIGKKKGETVEVAAPRGKMKFKILEIKAA